MLATGPRLSAQTSPSGQPVARIGDQVIYEEDLAPLIGGRLSQLKNQECELKADAVTKLINQRLLEAEAKKSGLSVERFSSKPSTKISHPGMLSNLCFFISEAESSQ